MICGHESSRCNAHSSCVVDSTEHTPRHKFSNFVEYRKAFERENENLRLISVMAENLNELLFLKKTEICYAPLSTYEAD